MSAREQENDCAKVDSLASSSAKSHENYGSHIEITSTCMQMSTNSVDDHIAGKSLGQVSQNLKDPDDSMEKGEICFTNKDLTIGANDVSVPLKRDEEIELDSEYLARMMKSVNDREAALYDGVFLNSFENEGLEVSSSTADQPNSLSIRETSIAVELEKACDTKEMDTVASVAKNYDDDDTETKSHAVDRSVPTDVEKIDESVSVQDFLPREKLLTIDQSNSPNNATEPESSIMSTIEKYDVQELLEMDDHDLLASSEHAEVIYLDSSAETVVDRLCENDLTDDKNFIKQEYSTSEKPLVVDESNNSNDCISMDKKSSTENTRESVKTIVVDKLLNVDLKKAFSQSKLKEAIPHAESDTLICRIQNMNWLKPAGFDKMEMTRKKLARKDSIEKEEAVKDVKEEVPEDAKANPKSAKKRSGQSRKKSKAADSCKQDSTEDLAKAAKESSIVQAVEKPREMRGVQSSASQKISIGRGRIDRRKTSVGNSQVRGQTDNSEQRNQTRGNPPADRLSATKERSSSKSKAHSNVQSSLEKVQKADDTKNKVSNESVIPEFQSKEQTKFKDEQVYGEEAIDSTLHKATVPAYTRSSGKSTTSYIEPSNQSTTQYIEPSRNSTTEYNIQPLAQENKDQIIEKKEQLPLARDGQEIDTKKEYVPCEKDQKESQNKSGSNFSTRPIYGRQPDENPSDKALPMAKGFSQNADGRYNEASCRQENSSYRNRNSNSGCSYNSDNSRWNQNYSDNYDKQSVKSSSQNQMNLQKGFQKTSNRHRNVDENEEPVGPALGFYDKGQGGRRYSDKFQDRTSAGRYDGNQNNNYRDQYSDKNQDYKSYNDRYSNKNQDNRSVNDKAPDRNQASHNDRWPSERNQSGTNDRWPSDRNQGGNNDRWPSERNQGSSNDRWPALKSQGGYSDRNQSNNNDRWPTEKNQQSSSNDRWPSDRNKAYQSDKFKSNSTDRWPAIGNQSSNNQSSNNDRWPSVGNQSSNNKNSNNDRWPSIGNQNSNNQSSNNDKWPSSRNQSSYTDRSSDKNQNNKGFATRQSERSQERSHTNENYDRAQDSKNLAGRTFDRSQDRSYSNDHYDKAPDAKNFAGRYSERHQQNKASNERAYDKKRDEEQVSTKNQESLSKSPVSFDKNDNYNDKSQIATKSSDSPSKNKGFSSSSVETSSRNLSINENNGKTYNTAVECQKPLDKSCTFENQDKSYSSSMQSHYLCPEHELEKQQELEKEFTNNFWTVPESLKPDVKSQKHHDNMKQAKVQMQQSYQSRLQPSSSAKIHQEVSSTVEQNIKLPEKVAQLIDAPKSQITQSVDWNQNDVSQQAVVYPTDTHTVSPSVSPSPSLNMPMTLPEYNLQFNQTLLPPTNQLVDIPTSGQRPNVVMSFEGNQNVQRALGMDPRTVNIRSQSPQLTNDDLCRSSTNSPIPCQPLYANENVAQFFQSLAPSVPNSQSAMAYVQSTMNVNAPPFEVPTKANQESNNQQLYAMLNQIQSDEFFLSNDYAIDPSLMNEISNHSAEYLKLHQEVNELSKQLALKQSQLLAIQVKLVKSAMFAKKDTSTLKNQRSSPPIQAIGSRQMMQEQSQTSSSSYVLKNCPPGFADVSLNVQSAQMNMYRMLTNAPNLQNYPTDKLPVPEATANVQPVFLAQGNMYQQQTANYQMYTDKTENTVTYVNVVPQAEQKPIISDVTQFPKQ